jgi:hypothetical protein
MGANEPPFVGQQRLELVVALLAEFDQVCQSGTPRWWSLEGHSGRQRPSWTRSRPVTSLVALDVGSWGATRTAVSLRQWGAIPR